MKPTEAPGSYRAELRRGTSPIITDDDLPFLRKFDNDNTGSLDVYFKRLKEWCAQPTPDVTR